MPSITSWTEAERDLFAHKLEELLHGPNPDRKTGFILITFPITDSSRAYVQSNCPPVMNLNVLARLAEGLMEQIKKAN